MDQWAEGGKGEERERGNEGGREERGREGMREEGRREREGKHYVVISPACVHVYTCTYIHRLQEFSDTILSPQHCVTTHIGEVWVGGWWEVRWGSVVWWRNSTGLQR